MGTLNRSQFKFKKYDTIGAEGAEEDSFLRECFVDIGAYAELADSESARCIVVGRTGTGKTALLSHLQDNCERLARIDPEQLSLQFLANSTIIRYLEELGVSLDLFYRLLWRHVLIVELIQLHYHLRSEEDQNNFLERVRERLFGDKKKAAALDYLVEWGERFWENTELRIHEVTKKLEDGVKASVGPRFKFFQSDLSALQSASVEDRQEIAHRAQEVVNGVQIAKLKEVTKILAEDVFNDPQKHYFIVIDGLDEDWVPDPLRYRLIRNLIEAIRDLREIRQANVVVAIRRDLLDRVFRYTRDTGFQEEKYQAFLLPLRWTDDQLIEVIDKRLNRLVQRQYSGRPISWADIFPRQVNGVATPEFLIARTHKRPRDIIQFVNSCISLATDRPDISAAMVRDAEAEYSRLRIRSLADEWAADYPHLLDIVFILKNRPATFPLNAISDEDLQKIAFRLMDFTPAPSDRLHSLAVEFLEERVECAEFRIRIAELFYDVGLVGIKTEVSARPSWAYEPTDRVQASEITPQSRLLICPMFHRVLATNVGGGSAV